MNRDRVLVPYEPWHLERLVQQVGCRSAGEELIGKAGPAFTGFVGHKVIAIGGVTISWPGVGDVFIFGSELIFSNKLWFHKQVLAKLDWIEKRYNLHRVQAAVVSGNGRACKWIEKLGFTCEGEMKKFAPDQTDCMRYAKVKHG